MSTFAAIFKRSYMKQDLQIFNLVLYAQTNMQRDILEQDTMEAAKLSTRLSRLPSIDSASFLKPSTQMFSHTQVRRQTWPYSWHA